MSSFSSSSSSIIRLHPHDRISFSSFSYVFGVPSLRGQSQTGVPPVFFLRLPTQKGSPRHSLCRLLHIDCLNETLIALLFITPICGIIGLSLRIAFKRSF